MKSASKATWRAKTFKSTLMALGLQNTGEGGFMDRDSQTRIIARSGTQDILFSREFHAPREMVFEAFTDPSMHAQWCNPAGFKTLIRRFDAHQGGSWSYSQRDPEGREFISSGVFHEVTKPFRIVGTFEFESPKKEESFLSLDITTFEDLAYGKTLIHGQSIFQSEAIRDAQIKAGVEDALENSYKRLEELLDLIQSKQSVRA